MSDDPRSAPAAATARPRAVEALDRALADWLTAFTVSPELAGQMADACAAGAAWPAAAAAVAAREAGWDEADAMAWGIAVGAHAGALEAARRSLVGGTVAEGRARITADGPAAALLASDALVAAAHEALGSLSAERLAGALESLERVFGDGGPWLSLPTSAPAAGWRAVEPLALAPLEGAGPSEETARILDAAERSEDRTPARD
ncbi:MAG: hypothetical protein KY397_03005 [Gemmatimonadetes bacterium]|nr:hypothetical protein [Gemmatimonadota bacterium]